MKKLTLYLLPLCLLYFSNCAGKQTALPDAVDSADTYVRFSSGKIKTLDPAVCYESEGMSVLSNMYETLLRIDPENNHSLVPLLATSVPRIDNGGISPDGRTYRFLIRKGVTFHNGAPLTPEDVAYSLKRNLMLDPDGGPMWMLLEAITGESSVRNRKGGQRISIFNRIMEAVETKEDYVIIHLKKPFAPFLTLLTQPAASIMNKAWAIENGCWDGSFSSAVKFSNPQKGREPLQSIVNGTGPYKLKEFIPLKKIHIVRSNSYRDNRSSVGQIIVRYKGEPDAHKRALLKASADSISLSYEALDDFDEKKQFRVEKRPHLHMDILFFCQNIATRDNRYIGSGKLNGKGIPSDFFSNIDIRKAFLHAFDRKDYQEKVVKDSGVIPNGPIAEGIPFAVNGLVYAFDLDQSKKFFMKAYDGKLWEEGFTLFVFYNSKNKIRKNAAENMAENIRSLNPKFNISARSLPWKEYFTALKKRKLPLFISGWAADYPDPHSFVLPLMKEKGVYASAMGYSDKTVNGLVEDGLLALNDIERSKVYEKLQRIWYDQALGLPLFQRYTYYLYQKGVKGILHPLSGYGPSEYYGSLQKISPVR